MSHFVGSSSVLQNGQFVLALGFGNIRATCAFVGVKYKYKRSLCIHLT